MDKAELCRIISHALQKLAPVRLDIDVTSDEEVRVTVVSKAFGGQSTKVRFDQVWGLLEQFTPSPLDQFQWSFELWTLAEAERLKIPITGNEKASDLNIQKSARSADLDS